MDKGLSQTSGCDTLNTRGAQCNVQMLPPTMNECGYESLKSPNCLNYYDGLFSTSIEVKEEFPEHECPQSSTAATCINKSSIDSNIGFENEELSKVPETRKIKQEVSDEALTFIKTEEIHDEKDKFIAKREISEEYRVLSNAGDTSVLYKVQTTPQENQPTMCGEMLKNGFHLFTHRSEHITTEPPTFVGNEGEELHKCQYCDEYVNDVNMLAHVDDVHSHKEYKSERYHESIKNIHTLRNIDEINYNCNFCKRVYKTKSALESHSKKVHNSYGRILECWCGEQFTTPKHLNNHQSREHDAINAKSTNNTVLKTEFQCDICKKMFKRKVNLITHTRNIHYDYGKTFNCWCGKQFRTPRLLCKHKRRLHVANANSANNAVFKTEYQCDICKKMFKAKDYLKKHKKSIHYDYGKAFGCWCGKQFRTPILLGVHKKRIHDANSKSTNNESFKKQLQCDICNRMFKYKDNLKQHILNNHCDFDKAFGC